MSEFHKVRPNKGCDFLCAYKKKNNLLFLLHHQLTHMFWQSKSCGFFISKIEVYGVILFKKALGYTDCWLNEGFTTVMNMHKCQVLKWSSPLISVSSNPCFRLEHSGHGGAAAGKKNRTWKNLKQILASERALPWQLNDPNCELTRTSDVFIMSD